MVSWVMVMMSDDLNGVNSVSGLNCNGLHNLNGLIGLNGVKNFHLTILPTQEKSTPAETLTVIYPSLQKSAGKKYFLYGG